MKIFETIEKNLMILGLNPNESKTFNWKITLGFILLSLGWIFSNVMLIFTMENITLMDYVNFSTIISSMIIMSIGLASIIIQQVKIFKIFENVQNLITESNLWF